MILLTIITGKMSKVSLYHFDNELENNGFFDICSDKYIKTNYFSNVSDKCKYAIISDFLSNLSRNKKFTSVVSTVSFPIFDGKEIIGTQGYYPILQDCLKDYIKETQN
jgi:hypothetical protein